MIAISSIINNIIIDIIIDNIHIDSINNNYYHIIMLFGLIMTAPLLYQLPSSCQALLPLISAMATLLARPVLFSTQLGLSDLLGSSGSAGVVLRLAEPE